MSSLSLHINSFFTPYKKDKNYYFIKNSLKATFLCSSGNKKILQITKNLWVLVSSSESAASLKLLENGIKTFEFYEGCREAYTIQDLWKEKPIRFRNEYYSQKTSSIETLSKVAFKISYIGTMLFILMNPSSKIIHILLDGVTLCSWTLMAIDSKQKLEKKEIKNRSEETKRLKLDLLTSTLEIISNIAYGTIPILVGYIIKKKFVEISTVKLISSIPLMLNIFAKTAGLASLIFKYSTG